MTSAKFKSRVRKLRDQVTTIANDVSLLMNGAGPQTAENVEAAVHALDIAELLLERAAGACEGREDTP